MNGTSFYIFENHFFFLMWTFWFISFGHFYIQLFISLSISKNPVCIRNIFSLIWRLFFFFFTCLLTLLIIFITKNIKKIFLSSSVYLWLYPESTWKSTLSHVDFGLWATEKVTLQCNSFMFPLTSFITSFKKYLNLCSMCNLPSCR